MRTITNTQHRLRIDHSLSEYRHLTTLQRRGPIPIRHAAISVLQWGSERRVRRRRDAGAGRVAAAQGEGKGVAA